MPCLTWASRTLIHPRRGPLSSVDPRPIRRPVFWSMVRVKGSVSQPSVTRAYRGSAQSEHGPLNMARSSARREAHRLNIIVSIEAHSLLPWIVANRCKNGWGKVDLLPIENLLSKWNQSNSDTECFKFSLDKVCHCDDVLAVGRIARHSINFNETLSRSLGAGGERTYEGIATAFERRSIKLSALASTYCWNFSTSDMVVVNVKT